MMGVEATYIQDVGDDDMAACFPLMRQLRPHLASKDEFQERTRRQGNQGYRLVAAWRNGLPHGLAGYRLAENLIHGPFLYVDDLIVDAGQRSSGVGARLMDWLKEEARRRGCAKLVLDTGLDNVLAHRFYYRQGLLALALRFYIPVA